MRTFEHFYPIFTDSAGPCLEGWIHECRYDYCDARYH
jgi:hypothetical protein